ncbi:MAG: hypothetical protein KKC79_16695 [Gammaproteobacteria bacterium]|nr:hypothetical protein [Gammaproteobacteria bacterium]
MALSILQGPAQGIRQASETRGTIGRRGGSINTTHVTSFRVDGRSAQFKYTDVLDVQDGDLVTLAGEAKKGVFKTYAMRNEQTGAIFTLPTWPLYVMAICLVPLGLFLLVIGIGVVFLVLAVWSVMVAQRYGSAERLLGQTVSPHER